MQKLIVGILLLSFSNIWSQVLVINELDADNPSIDSEEFIEIKSNTPNFSTNGYSIVFLMVQLAVVIPVT
jgi:hypothetical protein